MKNFGYFVMVYLEKKGQNTLKVCFREESLRQHEKSQKQNKKILKWYKLTLFGYLKPKLGKFTENRKKLCQKK